MTFLINVSVDKLNLKRTKVLVYFVDKIFYQHFFVHLWRSEMKNIRVGYLGLGTNTFGYQALEKFFVKGSLKSIKAISLLK